MSLSMRDRVIRLGAHMGNAVLVLNRVSRGLRKRGGEVSDDVSGLTPSEELSALADEFVGVVYETSLRRHRGGDDPVVAKTDREEREAAESREARAVFDDLVSERTKGER